MLQNYIEGRNIDVQRIPHVVHVRTQVSVAHAAERNLKTDSAEKLDMELASEIAGDGPARRRIW